MYARPALVARDGSVETGCLHHAAACIMALRWHGGTGALARSHPGCPTLHAAVLHAHRLAGRTLAACRPVQLHGAHGLQADLRGMA